MILLEVLYCVTWIYSTETKVPNQQNLVIAHGVGLVRQDDPRVFCFFFVFCFCFAWAISVLPSKERCGKITSVLRNWGGVRGGAMFSLVHMEVAHPSGTSVSRMLHRSGAQKESPC